MTRIQPVRGPIVRRAVAPFAALALLLGAAAALPPAPAPAQEQAATATPFRPVAVVNDSAVTAFDVEQRARLLRLLGFPAASVEALQGAALNALVEDRIKLQEAARIGIEPDDELLAEGLATLSSRLQVTPAELETLAANQGITGASLRDFVAANMAWRSVVRSRFASRIQPGEAEIDREFALGTAADQVDYRLQEIGLPVGQSRGPEATLRLAERIRTEATTTEAFAEAARRHSRTSTAEAGGEVGWMS
ncbi:MAG: peptidylprolyl isomerase, partial [Pseudomonadota bacterium]